MYTSYVTYDVKDCHTAVFRTLDPTLLGQGYNRRSNVQTLNFMFSPCHQEEFEGFFFGFFCEMFTSFRRCTEPYSAQTIPGQFQNRMTKV